MIDFESSSNSVSKVESKAFQPIHHGDSFLDSVAADYQKLKALIVKNSDNFLMNKET